MKRLITRNSTHQIFLNEDNDNYLQILKEDPSLFINYLEEKPGSMFAHLNSFDEGKLKKLLHSYEELFFKEGDNLTFTNVMKHEIKTMTDIPIYSKMYRYPEIHRKEVDRQIADMLRQGIIRHSNSPYNAPLWVVPKKLDGVGDQKWRIVIDYRRLNDHTIDDKFPMPNMADIFDKIGRCTYFSTLDLAKGFHQLEIAEEDRHKTAFSTSDGHYEFLRMPFGLKNAPSTFQRLMNTVLREYINKICVVYMDDILIFSTSFQEHLDSIKKIFQRLKQVNLKIQIDKCRFAAESTPFLGHMVTRDGIRTNRNTVEGILKIKVPTNVKGIKQFLGMADFYRKFIRDYTKVAYPMIRYLKKGTIIDPNDSEYLLAFDNLKKLLASDPVLQSPDFNKIFFLTTDESNYAVGSVLSQSGQSVCYASRTLNDHEIRYAAIEKELLAIVWAVKYFRTYLYGRKFTICTDHKPLVWLHNLREPNMKLQRWKLMLNEYDFDITYIKGKENSVADALSRLNTQEFDCCVLYNNDRDSNDEEEVEDARTTDATVHSAEDDAIDYIFITERPINMYKNQVYIDAGDQEKFVMKIVGRSVRNYVTVSNDSDLQGILQRVLKDKGTFVFYCTDQNLFVKIQDIYVQSFSNN